MTPVSAAFDPRPVASSAKEPAVAPGQGRFAEMLDSQVRATSARDQEASRSALPTEGPIESPFGGLPMANKTPPRGSGPEDVSFEVRRQPRTSAEESMGAEEADRTTPQDATAVKEENTTERETGVELEATDAANEVRAEGNAAFAAVDTADTGSDEEDVATMLAKAKVSATETSDESQSAREVAADAEAENEQSGDAESGEVDVDLVEVEGAAVKTEPSQAGLEAMRTQPGGREFSSPLVREAAPALPNSQWRTELVEQLQANQQMSQLKNGKIRLQLNEGGERLTVTLQEKNGVVNLSALTGSKSMAEAMNHRIEELREALADLGLALGDMETQADDSHGSEPTDEGGADADELADVSSDTDAGQVLPWLARSIVV